MFKFYKNTEHRLKGFKKTPGTGTKVIFKILKRKGGLLTNTVNIPTNNIVIPTDTNSIYLQQILKFSKNMFFRKKGLMKFLSKKLLKGTAQLLISKNFQNFKNTLRNIFFWVHYKKHRLLLLNLKSFFKKKYFTGNLVFKGIELVIKGRFMSPGGSKKRKKFFKVGQTSLKKKSKASIHNLPLRTPFGSLNIKLTIN